MLRISRRSLYWLRFLPGFRRLKVDGVRVDISNWALPKVVVKGLLSGSYEDKERHFAKQVLCSGMRVVEIGAGVGVLGLLAARLCGAGNVTSYEANPSLEATIRKNYALNNVCPSLVMRAVTVDGAPLRFFCDANIVSSSSFDRSRKVKQVTVESVRFADILAEHQPQTVIMDVEGAEVALLGTSPLEGVQHIIVELHPHIVGADVIDALIEGLKTKGFELIVVDRSVAHFRRKI